VHDEVAQAARDGYIVSRYRGRPGSVPFKTPWGWASVDCKGGIRWTTADDIDEATMNFTRV